MIPSSMKPMVSPGRRPWWPVLAAVTALLLGGGCSTPVGTERGQPMAVYSQVNEGLFTNGGYSSRTRNVLRRYDKVKAFDRDPQSVLRFLHDKALADDRDDLLQALAELAYLTAVRADGWRDSSHRAAMDGYLAAAVYAQLFLRGVSPEDQGRIVDRRIRYLCDLYNSALARALADRQGRMSLVPAVRRLPVGSLDLAVDATTVPWPLDHFGEFLASDEFLVRGLGSRTRVSGIGAPVIAVAKGTEASLTGALPLTVVLQMEEGALRDFGPTPCRATLHVFSPLTMKEPVAGRRRVPLEADYSAPLSYTLNQSQIWDLGMRNFLNSPFQKMGKIHLGQPFQPDKIPVLFVHGTMSSYVTWTEMWNTLQGDDFFRRHYQAWFYLYDSGKPLMYSARELEQAVAAQVKALDPGGRNPRLRELVVVGHSQGGLLTKMLVLDTGDTMIRALTGKTLAELKLSAHTKAEIRNLTVFTPRPEVRRVVFICTPHRGSYMASSLARRIARKMISLPVWIAQSTAEIARATASLQLSTDWKYTPQTTSIDGMSPHNPALQAVAKLPLGPGVRGNSIVAVADPAHLESSGDGVVLYASAHLDGLESEFIVQDEHSCLGNPLVIEEVRRILHQHWEACSAAPGTP